MNQTLWVTRNNDAPAVTVWAGAKPVKVEGFGWMASPGSCVVTNVWTTSVLFELGISMTPDSCVTLNCELTVI